MTDTVLPIARLHLTARAEAPLQLPPYAGSMLRGALGHALMALSPLPHPDGKPCALHATCPYCQIFISPPLPPHRLQKFSQMPHPFMVEPPPGGNVLAAGQTFEFALVLIGNALTHASTLIQAFARALNTGLGHEHARCTLLSVHHEATGTPLWPASGAITLAPMTLPAAPSLVDRATLRFTTPLRLQNQGKPVRTVQRLDARTLLVTLARRYQLLLDAHLGADSPQQDFARLSALASAIDLLPIDLRWFDWGRYSQRQEREMRLGGFVGTLQLRGGLAAFGPLLWLGQWLHVGKNASFGLGRYTLETTAL